MSDPFAGLRAISRTSTYPDDRTARGIFFFIFFLDSSCLLGGEKMRKCYLCGKPIKKGEGTYIRNPSPIIWPNEPYQRLVHKKCKEREK